jgi:hypothetical protein
VPILTVAIPTFNRARQLEKRLEEIARQWTPEIAVCVFDNASTDETPEVVARFAERFPIQHLRMDVNSGFLRNLLRCFEEPSTEWVWPLSDDDGLAEDSLASALACVKQTEADAIHFSTYAGGNPVDLVISTLEEYFRFKHDPCGLALISATIYRRTRLQPLFKVLLSGAFTLIPHVLLILTMLGGRSGKLELLKRCLLLPRGVSNQVRWSTREYAVGVSTLPEFLADPQDQRLAAIGLRAATRWMLFFALREVISINDARRWRRSVRVVNSTLRLYGGTAPYELRQSHYPQRQQFKQTIGILLGRWLPDAALVKLAARLRRRWGVAEPSNDFRETAIPTASGAKT